MTTKAITPQTSDFVKRLIAVGVMPHECRRMVLTIAANDVIRMEFEVNVTGEQMEQIVAALEANPEEAQCIARNIIFRELGGLKNHNRFAEVKLP
jgi:hypothetical protein